MSKESAINSTILVTGGTGSFGQAFVSKILKEPSFSKVIVFSRDEWKQSEMAQRFRDERLRFFLGDVRDLLRLQRALEGVDYVVHAAALKQVPALEYNPFEAIQTNVIGSQNLINACLDQNVKKVVAISTDKAVCPVNLYGATKLCAEKLFMASKGYAANRTIFSVVRYGNVIGSRGSVIPLFKEKAKEGVLPVTDKRMTRFWITLDQAVLMVLTALETMNGGEIFVPKVPSMSVLDLGHAIAPESKIVETGVRQGEKLTEVLITEEESSRTFDAGSYYVIRHFTTGPNGHHRLVPSGFRYASDTNSEWLKPEEIRGLV